MMPSTNQPTTPAEDSPENEQQISPDNPGGTAPDSDTQSSAASSAGDRTTNEGSSAPEDPAEGTA